MHTCEDNLHFENRNEGTLDSTKQTKSDGLEHVSVLHSAQTRLVMIKTAQARDFLSPWRPKLLWD